MTRVIIIHQHDPTVSHVSGIGTFIDTFITYAPDDFEISLIGVTADPRRHPVGRWDRLHIGGRVCSFLPIVAGHSTHRGRLPLSLRLTMALMRDRRRLNLQHAILEFHRIEPSLALWDVENPKVLFLHGHMQDLRNPQTEVAWGKFPWLYFWLERRLIRAMQRTYLVREDAVAFYRVRYPNLAERFDFLPTWVDESSFLSMVETQRDRIREELTREQHVDPRSKLLLFVGRFEGQKDPLLLLEAVRRLNGQTGQAVLILIGAGSLEGSMRAFIRDQGLSKSVRILGPQPQWEIARWMNVADCLCLSSAFEGMPRVVVEALHCGLPVVSTDVGEVRRFFRDQRIGRLVTTRSPEAFSAAIAGLLSQEPDRAACQQQTASYTAAKVLAPVYQAYRELKQK